MQLPILVVDDEKTVRAFAAAVLRRARYTVLEASDGRDALNQIEARDGALALVLTDIRMPNMDGLELATRAKRRFPALCIVLMSAYSADPLPSLKMRFFLSKPFPPASLLETVSLAMKGEAA